MRTRIKKGIAAAVTATCAAALLFVGNAGTSAAAAPSLPAFGLLSGGKTMCAFTTDRPDTLNWVKAVTGLSGDTSLIGIDIRVQDGLLYGVGNQGGIYTIKTPPQSPDVVMTKVSQLTIALYGTNFGVDFNPAADRLRIISDNGQNLRHNLNDHTTVEDAVLTTPPNPAPTKGVTAAAYTNNDRNGDTATTLFGINTITDQLVIQSPANNGTLAPVGALGVDAGPDAGLDIFSDLTNGKTTSVLGFATLVTPDGATSLYTVNLFTGATTPPALPFPLSVTDLAVSLDTA
jgi:hypothetical protein